MKTNDRDLLIEDLTLFAGRLTINGVCEFDPRELVPEERIRVFCVEDKCGNYNKNYMCPPHVGSITETRKRLLNYQRGVLFQYSQSCNVKENHKRVEETKLDFHRKILELEDFMKARGIGELWGLIGGSCALCEKCYAQLEKPCPYPEKARPSLESLGIDLISLLRRLGLDTKFHSNKITWTGCILF